MDYEALKDQWNDAEERDGVRLSWNTFPSTRMVRFIFRKFRPDLWSQEVLTVVTGGISACGPHWSCIHPIEGAARRNLASV